MILEQNEVKLLGDIAFMSLWQGHFNEADTIFTAVHHNSPDKIGSIIGLAHSKAHQGQYNEALELINKALVLNPYDEHAKVWLGMLYFMMSDKNKAKTQLTAVLETCQSEDVLVLAQGLLTEINLAQ